MAASTQSSDLEFSQKFIIIFFQFLISCKNSFDTLFIPKEILIDF